ncbi:YidB family protein [Microvirga sp. G4-2]|uniref:YidB family protein n=1 Tax=Microvirga sp. G4-2 TaxID=3434467 RepID=UPI00404476D6
MSSRGFPSMTALLGLLAIAGYQNRDKIAEMMRGGQRPGAPGQPGQLPGQQAGGLGGLGGLLGGLGGAGAGGLLNGGLGELVDRFRQNGQGDVADSWVSTGPNKEIAPQQLEQAIGPDVLATLTQQTGLSREEILARLSRELPQAVDQYTPEGRIPAT